MSRPLMLLSLVVSTYGRFYDQNVPMVPFPDVKCADITFTPGAGCSCATTISGSVVDVEEGFDPATDTLTCPGCAALGITTNFDSSTGILQLSGDATIDEYAQAMASVEFTSTSGAGTSRRLTYNFGHAMYSTKTGHFYEYYPRNGVNCNTAGGCHWDDAQAECADTSKDILGLAGYLITITSQTEQDLISAKLPGEGWFGSGDVDKEGEWRWLTGPEGCPPYNLALTGAQRTACDLGYPLPEALNPCTGPDCGQGQLIGSGEASEFTTAAGAYENWAFGEPNDYRDFCPGTCDTTGEDFGHYDQNGRWNDYPTGHSNIEGYVCEWGGVGELCMRPGDVYGTQILVVGCGFWTNSGACEAHLPNGLCKWDTAQNPAVCVVAQPTPELVGCFSTDESPRQLGVRAYTGSGNTVELCAGLCYDNGYKYAGLEYGDECWCGDSLPGVRVGGNKCSRPCSGDASQVCGDGYRASVYVVDGSSVAMQPNPEQVGCFSTDESPRQLGVRAYTGSENTVELCAEVCNNNGYKYAGLEYGDECWCGDALPGVRVGREKCTKPCSGDASQVCGHVYHASVYVVDGSSVAAVSKTYEGCYADSPSRILPVRAFRDGTWCTVDECVAVCSHNGYAFAGLQARKECWCGATLPVGPPLADRHCRMSCSGNHNEVCGYYWRSSVYSTM